MAVHGISIDQNAYRASLKLKDERPLLCLVHDYAFSNKASGTLLDGIARFSTPGSEFVFTRPGTETFTNPVGDSETAPINSPGYADGGLQMLAGSGSRYYVTNNSGARTFSAALGGYQCEIKLLGTLAQDRVIAYAYHDASNYMKLWYDNASTKIKFTMRVDGTSTTATALASPSTSTWHQIGIYWTSENGENDLPPYSMALYIDRVLQETVIGPSKIMTEAAVSKFDFGSAAGSDILRGQIRKIVSYQYVPTDTEMKRTL